MMRFKIVDIRDFNAPDPYDKPCGKHSSSPPIGVISVARRRRESRSRSSAKGTMTSPRIGSECPKPVPLSELLGANTATGGDLCIEPSTERNA